MRRFISPALEYLIRVLPLPPKLVLLLHELRGVRFKDRASVFIRPMVQLASRFPDEVAIGRHVFFDVYAMVLTDCHLPDRSLEVPDERRVTIEDGVYIGMGAIILAGVTLRTGAVVLPGSVVYEDVAPHTMVRGNPARKVKRLPEVSRNPLVGRLKVQEARAVEASGGSVEEAYDENGVSLRAFPYDQAFLRALVERPAVLLKSFLMYAILNWPIPPRAATRLFALMGIRFEDWRTSGIVLPIFLDPINPEGITIGAYSHISNNSLIASHFFDPYHPGFYYRKARVTIRDNVFLGMGVILGAGVEVGSFSIVSANTVLFRNVGNNLGIIGNPGRAFKKTPSCRRDYELTGDADKKFYDDTGKSVDLYHFEHRLGVVLKENPKRILNFFLESLTSLMPLPVAVRAKIYQFWGIQIKHLPSLKLGNTIYLERLVPERLFIGRNVTIGDRVKVLAHYVEDSVDGCYFRSGDVVIEDDVVLGANTVIANNVTIGRGAVIMPGTLIVSDVPPGAVIGGVPSENMGKRS